MGRSPAERMRETRRAAVPRWPSAVADATAASPPRDDERIRWVPEAPSSSSSLRGAGQPGGGGRAVGGRHHGDAGDAGGDRTDGDRMDAYSFYRVMHGGGGADAAASDAAAAPTDALAAPRVVAAGAAGVATTTTLERADDEVAVTIETDEPWAHVRFTTDGAPPSARSALYRRPFLLRGADLAEGGPVTCAVSYMPAQWATPR